MIHGQRSRECEVSRYRHGCDPPQAHGQCRLCLTTPLQSWDLHRVLRIAFISFLCLGVFLQILGVPISFWNLNCADEAVTATLLCGFAVITNESFLPLHYAALLVLIGVVLGYFYEGQNVPFRPPLPLNSFIYSYLEDRNALWLCRSSCRVEALTEEQNTDRYTRN